MEIERTSAARIPIRTSAYRVLALACLAEVLAMTVWFSFSAVKPLVAEGWQVSNAQVGLVLSAFQLGYIVAVVAVGYLSDVVNDRKVLALSCLAAGALNLAFALLATNLLTAMALRFLVGAAMAGVYTPGIRLLASWFSPQARGQAVGLYVGALVLGSASPYLLAPLAAAIGWQALVLATVVAAVLASGVWWLLVPDAPSRSAPPTRGFNPAVLRDRPLLLMNLAYTAHMWELYAMWGWIGPFVTFALASQGVPTAEAAVQGGQIAFLTVAAGGAACAVAGRLSDRFGRTRTAGAFLVASALCSFGFGFLTGAPAWVLATVGVVYGFAIVGDSPVFSTGITELAPAANRGAALGVQSVLGFGITIVSTALFGVVVDLLGWAAAFIMLGLGATLGPLALWRLYLIPVARRALAAGRG